MFQEDFTPDVENVDTFTVSDEKPSAIKILVVLSQGSTEDLTVALDTFGDPVQGVDGGSFAWAMGDDEAKLPSRVQIHASSEVCVKQVDIYFQNRTGADLLAMSIPSAIFGTEACRTLNVCDMDSENSCGRSLAYFKHHADGGCVVLKPNEARFPRDLSLNLFDNFCGRLTTWSHPDLGEPILIELDSITNASESILVKESFSGNNVYEFSPTAGVKSFVIDEASTIPTDFQMMRGSGATVASLRVSRYGLTLTGAFFNEMFDCINFCQPIAEPGGIKLGPIKEAYLTLLEEVSCKRLPYILPSSEDFESGRDICTVTVDVDLLSDIVAALYNISEPNQPYRTVLANVTVDKLTDETNITLQDNRGLRLLVDFDVRENLSFLNEVSIHVQQLSELEIDGFAIGASSSIKVDALGTFELVGSEISRTDRSCFLDNSGETSFTSVLVNESTVLCNQDQAFLDLTYVQFADSSVIQNADEATLRISQLVLYEDFSFPVAGTVELPDVRRLYTILNETDDPLCLGNSFPENIIELDATGCVDRCEDVFVCSGAFTYINETDYSPRCGLCLSEDDCSYDCSGATRQYQKPTSKFNFVKIQGCPVLSRPYDRFFASTSLEECKLLCSYYETCEGFRLVGKETATLACQLIADLDFTTDCSPDEKEEIYIPFIENDATDFVEVGGELTQANSSIMSHGELNFDECAAICSKTLGCLSFISTEESGCDLYDTVEFLIGSAEKSGLHISTGGIFPKKRFLWVDECLANDSFYTSSNTKTLMRCEDRCNDDLSCAGFVFDQFQDLFVHNCFLYTQDELIASLLFEETDCTSNKILNRTIGLGYALDEFDFESDREFSIVESFSDVLLDECKEICLAEMKCVALKYSVSDQECWIGVLEEKVPINMTGTDGEEYLALRAESIDASNAYLSVPGVCYRGEPLGNVTVDYVEKGKGYYALPRLCLESSTSGNFLSSGSPAECGLVCNLIGSGCKGFVYYRDGNRSNQTYSCSMILDEVIFADQSCQSTGVQDIYLRSEESLVCQALCDLHGLCSAFVFQSGSCKLYSDIEITSECSVGGEMVNVALGNRERDALVRIPPGHCFVDFENTLQKGCYISDESTLKDLVTLDLSDLVTPHSCQKGCESLNNAYYGVGGNDIECYCADYKFYGEWEKADAVSCESPCTGDSSQTCGGNSSVVVGLTVPPIRDITEEQCKKACFDDPNCVAVQFIIDDTQNTNSICTLRTTGLYEPCSEEVGESFIESLEHFYESPTLPYFGKTSYFTTTTDLRQDCQRLCDVFAPCESTSFLERVSSGNCELLGGSIIELNGTANSAIEVARDVTLFTRADPLAADKAAALLPKAFRVFDLDECRALCESHVSCGAITFFAQMCQLFAATSFAENNLESSEQSDPYYVDYRGFVDIEKEFVEAEGLCVDPGTAAILATRATVQSRFDCSARCNSLTDCILFTYNDDEKKDCVLHGPQSMLTSECDVSNKEKVYVLFTRGSFTRPSEGEDAYLVNESEIVMVNGKGVVECATLCDDLFTCSSFRIDPKSGTCKLFDRADYLIGPSQNEGELYIYYSEYYFVQLPSSFCVSTLASIAFVADAPIEACKLLCDKIDECIALEHDQDGNCQLYDSNDFSVPCTGKFMKNFPGNDAHIISLITSSF